MKGLKWLLPFLLILSTLAGCQPNSIDPVTDTTITIPSGETGTTVNTETNPIDPTPNTGATETTAEPTHIHNFSDGTCTVCAQEDPDYVSVTMVWIPTKGGTKYHAHAGCSNMDNPEQVTLSEAESRGFTPCKRCH